MIRLFIADDHAIVREGLKQIVAETPDMVVADEAANGQQALAEISRKDYDVVILDITMPGISGLDVLRQIRAERPALPVLILSIHPEEQYALRALKAGASGYLTKESAPDELIAAVKEVLAGRKYISPPVAQSLASHLDVDAKRRPHEGLSDREYEIMIMIAMGKNTREMSEALHLSTKTINTYRYRIFEKMGIKDNAEIIRYAIKSRLVD